MDWLDNIDEAELEMFGIHVEDDTPIMESIVCEWGCGDNEGLCVVDRFGCYMLGCQYARVE